MKYTFKSYQYIGTQPEMQDSLSCAEKPDLFILADGIGPEGAAASQMAVDGIEKDFSSQSAADFKKVFASLSELNEMIKPLNGGTSLAFARLQGQRLLFHNFGETKIMIFRDDKPVLVTPESQTAEESCICLGQADVLPEGLVKQEPWKLQQGDAVLLCTGGFWKMISTLEMEADLLKSQRAEDWVQYMVCRILMKLGKNGQSENLSVIALVFRE